MGWRYIQMANKDTAELLVDATTKLSKALRHLEYSYQKILKLPEHLNQQDEESLEVWESFAARFSRASDLFLSRYIRALALYRDPGFEGTLRDYLNIAEKEGVITDSPTWLNIRQLRNKAAHEYNDQRLEEFYLELKEKAPLLLQLKKVIQHAS
jgi:hypothetical protein